MASKIFLMQILFGIGLICSCNIGFSQLPNCTSSGQGIMFYTKGAFNDTIFSFNTFAPISVTNPNVNSILLPNNGNNGHAITLCNNLNASTPIITFYTTIQYPSTPLTHYYYYDGNSWINTGHLAHGGGAIAGGGGYIYSIFEDSIFRYNGLGNATFFIKVNGYNMNNQLISADCAGNLYVLNLSTNQFFRKYNTSGVLVNSWAISGLPSSQNYFSVGMIIAGNKIYFRMNSTPYVYIGSINNNNINFQIDSTSFPFQNTYPPTFMASCPFGANVAVANVDTIYHCTNGNADTLMATGYGPYTWSVLNGPATIYGSGDTVTVSATANATVVLSSAALSVCGADSDTVAIIVAPIAHIVSNNSPLCAGNTLQLAANGIAFMQYSWSGPQNFHDTLQNTQRTPITLADSGFYKVTAGIGNCSSSDSVFVHVKPVPNIPNISSNSPLCVGDTLKLNISNIQNGVSYQWHGPLGFNSTIANATRANMQLNDAGNYILKDTLNACAGKTDTVQVVVQANTTPTVSISAVPSNFTAAQNVSFTASPSNCNNPIYQWYLNGTQINGATSNPYNTTLNTGDQISLSIHCNGQCQTTDSARSNTLTTVGISNLNPTTILIYPNPIHNELIIQGAANTSLKVYDLVGRIIYSNYITTNQQSINTNQWERGTYFVELVLPDGSKEVRKVVK